MQDEFAWRKSCMVHVGPIFAKGQDEGLTYFYCHLFTCRFPRGLGNVLKLWSMVQEH